MKKSEKPLVSVIIPTYNRAHLLPRAITSVLSQTLKDFELIIVDDGSTDNTREVVESFQKKDKRIRYIWQENSGGPAKPKNMGIKNSRGKYIGFLDDDDEWLPEKLKKQLKVFEQSKNLGIVGCSAFYVDSNTKKTRINKIKRREDKNYSIDFLKGTFLGSSSSIVIPMYIFNNIGLYDESFSVADDWDLYLRIIQKYDFESIDDPLFNYYIHGDNISGIDNASTMAEENIKIISKNKEKYERNLRIKSNILSSAGFLYAMAGDKKNAKKCFLNSINCNPFNFRNYLNLAVFLLGNNFYFVILKIRRSLLK